MFLILGLLETWVGVSVLFNLYLVALIYWVNLDSHLSSLGLSFLIGNLEGYKVNDLYS